MQEVQLDKRVKLLDSPGVVMARAGGLSALMLSNTVKVSAVPTSVSIWVLLYVSFPCSWKH